MEQTGKIKWVAQSRGGTCGGMLTLSHWTVKSSVLSGLDTQIGPFTDFPEGHSSKCQVLG